jgi:hypothetical protein
MNHLALRPIDFGVKAAFHLWGTTATNGSSSCKNPTMVLPSPLTPLAYLTRLRVIRPPAACTHSVINARNVLI